MADLDDFFAKKDRKKSKTITTKKFATPEEVSKKIDDTATAAKKPEVRARKEPQPQLQSNQPDGTIDEVPNVVEVVRLIFKFLFKSNQYFTFIAIVADI